MSVSRAQGLQVSPGRGVDRVLYDPWVHIDTRPLQGPWMKCRN